MLQDATAKGILICGSGIGVSIAANRFSTFAQLSHRCVRDYAVSIMMPMFWRGERLTGVATAMECVDTFLLTDFEGGRHQRRVDKLISPQPASS